MLRYTEEKMGELTIKQNGRKFKIDIRTANCLAAFIHVRKADDGKGYIHTLYSFFADEKHLKNIIKAGDKPFTDEVVKIRLNMRYKGCYTLLKLLVPFYKIECYYK